MTNNIKFPICEMFHSIQGEGKYTGIPSIFVRVSGCNLRCVFAGGSRCDTPYSSFDPEKTIYSDMDAAVNEFNKLSKRAPSTTHVVITGGEPLLFRNGLSEFLTRIFRIRPDWTVTIETNGTLPPLNAASDSYRVDLYSVSPKLSTSVDTGLAVLSKEQADHHNATRLNYEALYDMVMYSNDYQFKFVYSGPQCVGEILDIYSHIADKAKEDNMVETWMVRHPNKNCHTLLMPEGIANEQLARTRMDAAQQCIDRGWRFCEREHIVIWGDKRGV